LLFDLRTLLLSLPGILFGFTIHEFAHAYAAYRMGDDTAARQGRLTLNPLMHLDLMGTILILIAGFGWARPVPINPSNFKNPRQGDLIATAAGPLSNLVTAIVLALVYKFLPPAESVDSIAATFSLVLYRAIWFNLLLCFFNLIPIFPLDGARIVRALLPLNQAYAFSQLESMGPIILLGLIAIGPYAGINVVGMLIGPPITFFMSLLT
jgi:Zn-dependent protease